MKSALIYRYNSIHRCGLLKWFCFNFDFVHVIDIFKKDIKTVIDLYTPNLLRKIAGDIAREEVIFKTAFIIVNMEYNYDIIFQNNNINLLDIICESHMDFKNMLSLECFHYFSKDHLVLRQEYLQKLYLEYKKLGGNEKVIIFGLPEYLAGEYNIIYREDIQFIYKLLARDSYLRKFVMGYGY